MFSVVIPVYNKRRFIATTLASVLAQDFADFEVWVVDDGSRDGSIEALADLADNRMQVIRQVNQGVGPARNAGILASTRPWVAFLDADDLWAPNHLTALRAAAEVWPNAGFLSTRWAQVSDVGKFGTNRSERSGAINSRLVDFFQCSIDDPRYFHTSGVAIRRDVLEKVGGFGSFQPGEDVELWVRVALATPTAIAMVTTDGRRRDVNGLTARAVLHVPTSEISTDNLPTPVLRVLANVLDVGHSLPNRKSVERYFDLRLAIGIKAALRNGDRRRAWTLWRLMKAPSLIEKAAMLMPTRLAGACKRCHVYMT